MIEIRRVSTDIENNSPHAILTVIIPIRGMSCRDITDRLGYCLNDSLIDREKVNFIVVDDGSNLEQKNQFKEECLSLKIDYIYIDTQFQPFSIARARNIGAMNAKTEFIMFMDVDLYPYDGFYNQVISEISIQGLRENANEFLMIGVIYLTPKRGQELFFSTSNSDRKNLIIQKVLENDETIFEKFSTGTSVNVYNRLNFLSHGGNDEDFEEWGYDDLEYNIRMIRDIKKFPYPTEILKDFKNFRTINEYKGWKSVYRLFGDIMFQKGIILFHIWHEVDQKSDYIKGKEKNRRLFEKKIEDYARYQTQPAPLPCTSSGRTLIFSDSNPFVYNREILPELGFTYKQDETSHTGESIVQFVKTNSIDRVLMFNPYGTEHRLSLYQALKGEKIPVLVAERGALRNSLFYDWNGFNAESKSYSHEFWDFPLKKEKKEKLENYIKNEINTDHSLERQVSLQGASKLRKKLGLGVHEKIFFVPLQRPSDSVIKHFCGKIGDYSNFIKLVQETADNLPVNWKVIVKKHPLEDDIPKLNNVIFTDANIKDLIELSDYIFLINSGVGVLSLLWNKPVLYAGKVFYADNRLNREVSTFQEIKSALQEKFSVDIGTCQRFLSYLINDFYSFGTFKTKEIPWEDGGRMTVTTGIKLYQIRNLTDSNRNYSSALNRIEKNSMLFDRYNSIVKKETIEKEVVVFKNIVEQSPPHSPVSIRAAKKIKKLRESPQRFFNDSTSSFIQGLGKVKWKK